MSSVCDNVVLSTKGGVKLRYVQDKIFKAQKQSLIVGDQAKIYDAGNLNIFALDLTFCVFNSLAVGSACSKIYSRNNIETRIASLLDLNIYSCRVLLEPKVDCIYRKFNKY